MKIRTDFITNSSSSSFVAFVVPKGDALVNMNYEMIFEKVLQSIKDSHKKYADLYEKNPKYYEDDKREIAKLEAMQTWEREEYASNEIDVSEYFINKRLEVGGIENNWVGMPMSTILSNYPDLKISEIKGMVADTINREFGTNFSDKDVVYVEEAWMDN